MRAIINRAISVTDTRCRFLWVDPLPVLPILLISPESKQDKVLGAEFHSFLIIIGQLMKLCGHHIKHAPGALSGHICPEQHGSATCRTCGVMLQVLWASGSMIHQSEFDCEP